MFLVLVFALSLTSAANEASLVINVTFFGNYTPFGVSDSDMSDYVFVGNNSSAFGKGLVSIPLTRSDGSVIVDLDSTDDVAGLHVIRKDGYVQIAAYGFNNKASRESIKANFSFLNASIFNVSNNASHPYENNSDGFCGVNMANISASKPGNDEYGFGSSSGFICSTTNVNADIIKIFYNLTASAYNSTPKPNVTILYPVNTTVLSTNGTSYFLNFSANSTQQIHNWSYIFNGVLNGSFISDSFNFSGWINATLGINNLTVCGTNNGTACDVVSFNVIRNSTGSGAGLFIDILSPESKTYSVQKILVNLSTNGTQKWYNWNGTNITYSVPIVIEFPEGYITLNAWANDSFGNLTHDSVSFRVNLDDGKNRDSSCIDCCDEEIVDPEFGVISYSNDQGTIVLSQNSVVSAQKSDFGSLLNIVLLVFVIIFLLIICAVVVIKII